MATPLTRTQQLLLVLLRTLIGWHFVYEGFVKLWWPSWSRAGAPLGHWSAASYLRGSSGPLAFVFRGLGEASWLPWIDTLVAWSLLLVGLGLMLGLLTRFASAGALLLLALFYLSSLPTGGLIEPGAEGNYLFVNKNLVEAAAVAVLLAFRTESIAGLDLLFARPRAQRVTPAAEAAR